MKPFDIKVALVFTIAVALILGESVLASTIVYFTGCFFVGRFIGDILESLIEFYRKF